VELCNAVPTTTSLLYQWRRRSRSTRFVILGSLMMVGITKKCRRSIINVSMKTMLPRNRTWEQGETKAADGFDDIVPKKGTLVWLVKSMRRHRNHRHLIGGQKIMSLADTRTNNHLKLEGVHQAVPVNKDGSSSSNSNSNSSSSSSSSSSN